jgi:uncharacterized cupredoxin-like copper-binding protein
MTRSIRRPAALLAALVLTLVLAACAGTEPTDAGSDANGAAAPSGDAVTLVVKEFFFEPDAFTVPAGTDVEVVVDNQGVVEHDFVVEGYEGNEIYATPGTTASGTINLPAGAHTFYCSIPGHRASGMEGTVTAQ